MKIEPRSSEAAALGVTAFARGEEVHVAPGKYRPETAAGRRILGHELTHVAQQRRGIVRPTGERGEHEVNDEPRLEREAERIGSRAAIGGDAPAPPPMPPAIHRGAGNVAQCMDGDDDEPAGRRRRKQGVDAAGARHGRAADRAEQGRAARDREFERRRLRAAAIAELTSKSTGEMTQIWRAVMGRAQRSISAIEEISGRLQGADARIAARLSALNNQARLVFLNFAVVDEEVGRRQDDRRDDDKEALAAIILEGQELQRQLGEVSNRAEGSLNRLDAFQGDLDNYRYHTGRNAADAIPIVWYKNPGTDYLPIVIPGGNAAGVTAGNYAYPNGPRTADGFPFNLVVAAGNRPALNSPNAFVLQKQAIGSRPTTTPNKDDANQQLRNAGYGLRERGRTLDGDHVRDLGFGGDDAYDNYWPLETRVNQRAYFGYNRGYIINYIDHRVDDPRDAAANPQNNPDGRPTSQPIGGLVGRYFTIKAYMNFNDNAAVPAEGRRDNTEAWSGTDQFN